MAEQDGEKRAGGPEDAGRPRPGDGPPDLSPEAEGTPGPAPGGERADPAPGDEPVIPPTRPGDESPPSRQRDESPPSRQRDESPPSRPGDEPDPLAAAASEVADPVTRGEAGLGGSVAPAALGMGLPPPVGAAGLSDDAALRTDAADPLMPPAEESRAADRPMEGFGAPAQDTPEDARAPEPDEARDGRPAEPDRPRVVEPDEEREAERIVAMPSVGRPDPVGGEPSVSGARDPGSRDDPATDDEPKVRPHETPAAAVERRGGGGLFGTFLLSVLAAGAVAYGVLWFFDRQGDEEQVAAVDAVRVEGEAAVADLEARLDERLAGIETSTADLAARLEEEGGAEELVARLEALDARLAEVQTGSEGAAATVGGQVAELAERVDALYAGLPEGGAEGVEADALTPLRQALSAQDERLSEIAARLDELGARLEGAGGSEEVEALRGEVQSGREELSQQIAGLREEASAGREELRASLQSAEEARASIQGDVEAVRGDVDALRGDVDTLRGDVDAVRSTLDTQQSRLEEEVAAARAEADADAAQARAQAVLARMTAAIEAGTPYDRELTELLGLVDTQVPATLINESAAGVPSLPDLRRAFPEAAREALLAAPAAGETGRVEGFLRRQLGVRSLEAREGEGTDAVLSRAEAALEEGELEAAIAELEALPPEARGPMEGWIEDAEARVIIQEAATELASQLEAG